MDNDTILTDEYVAELLAKEAKDCSVKYSAMGLDAYNASRPSNKMKPNTRFLRHIIKETKNHNEALLAKEAAEAQARLQDLKDATEEKRKRQRPEPRDIRSRQLGDITAILQGRKRKKRDEGDVAKDTSPQPRSDREHESRRSTDNERRHRRRGRDLDEDSSRRRREGRLSPPSEEEDNHGSRRERRPRDGSRSRSPQERHRRHRHRSPLDEDESNTKSRHRKHHHHRHHHSKESSRKEEDRRDIESDPLEDAIGPLPPALARPPRGRGTVSGSSRMDNRFADDYDPKSDVQPDDDEGGDDWDDALEALRDRARWRQQGAERLRAAGFTEEQVSAWEKSGGEKGIGDVRWSRAGEKREWDRGKVVGEDGSTKTTAEWKK